MPQSLQQRIHMVVTGALVVAVLVLFVRDYVPTRTTTTPVQPSSEDSGIKREAGQPLDPVVAPAGPLVVQDISVSIAKDDPKAELRVFINYQRWPSEEEIGKIAEPLAQELASLARMPKETSLKRTHSGQDGQLVIVSFKGVGAAIERHPLSKIKRIGDDVYQSQFAENDEMSWSGLAAILSRVAGSSRALEYSVEDRKPNDPVGSVVMRLKRMP